MGFWSEEVVTAAEEKTGDFEVLPEGEYRVLLINTEVKKTKAGGHYVNATFELHGNSQYDGRKLFAKFNVDNANSTAVSIGLGQIKELAAAVGHLAWYEDLKQSANWDEAEAKLNGMFDTIGNIPVEAKVTIKKDEKYGNQNEIKRFKPLNNTTPALSATTKPAANAKKNPWEK